MDKLFNLGNISDAERALMEKRKVDFSKIRSKFKNESRKDSKPTECLVCKQETPKFCNSHSMPASFLRNIAVEGKVHTTNKIIDMPLLGTEEGVNKIGTFKLICRDCDSKIFQEYEEPANYNNAPTDKMIAQIAMKNHLRSIGKRRDEISLYKNLNGLGQINNPFINGMLEVQTLDLNEYLRGFKKAKRAIEKNWENEYYLFFSEKLNYVVPLAFQGEISLHFDLDGNIINDVYNKSKKYIIQTIHISVFPLESTTIIMLFIDKNHKRYRRFYQQFNKLNLEQKLGVINFIIFSYAEDVFMSKKLHENYLKNENLQKVADLTSIQFFDGTKDGSNGLKNSFDLSNMNNIPNFLLIDVEKGS